MITVHNEISQTIPVTLIVNNAPRINIILMVRDISLCMTPRARVPHVQDSQGQEQHCAWFPGPGYLNVHDSPGQGTSLCMTPKARMPHCA